MRTLLVASALALCLSHTSVFAESAETEAFEANVRLGSVFLASSSVLAADRSENESLRAFASKESSTLETVIATVNARSPSAAPVNVASNDVVTGRSAAIDQPATYSAPEGMGALMPAALITLDHLTAAKGQSFDTLYKSTQLNALHQLADLYNAYAMTGDDLALKQMAKTELAITNDRITDLAGF